MEDYVKEEVTIIRNDVIEVNTADTDMIASPYHLTEGARGAPGVPGMNGFLGVNGYNGAPGPQGPKGPQGAPGPIGAQGSQGGYGSEGQRGPDGRIGGPGGNGPTGSNGDEGGDGDSDGGRLVAPFARVVATRTHGSWTAPLAHAAWKRTTTACGALSAPPAWGQRLQMSSAVGWDTPKGA